MIRFRLEIRQRIDYEPDLSIINLEVENKSRYLTLYSSAMHAMKTLIYESWFVLPTLEGDNYQLEEVDIMETWDPAQHFPPYPFRVIVHDQEHSEVV